MAEEILIEEIIIKPVYGKGFRLVVHFTDGSTDEELSTSIAKYKKQLKKYVDEMITDHVKRIK